MADLYGEKKDGRGQHMVTPITDFRKQRFLEWLTTPIKERSPNTVSALAKELGLERKTLYNWQEDKEFVEAWEKRYLKTIGNPTRKQTIMDTLYATATDPDDPKHVQAAKQYFEIEGSLRPTKHEVHVTGSAKTLTDEDLDRLLAEMATSEKDKRSSA